MKKIRIGAAIGVIGGLLTILALYINLFEFQILSNSYSLSVNDCTNFEEIGAKSKEAWGIVFNIYLSLGALTIIFSLLSNRRNLLAILTLLISGINFGMTYLMYTTAKDEFSVVQDIGKFSFGMGMYFLLFGSALAIVGSLFAIAKK